MDLQEKRKKLLSTISALDMHIGQLQAELAEMLQQQQQMVGAVRFCDELIVESTSSHCDRGGSGSASGG